MMQLRSTISKSLMQPEAANKCLSVLQRKIGGCLRPNRALVQGSRYGEVISKAIMETDAFVASSLQWENIFGISFPIVEGEM